METTEYNGYTIEIEQDPDPMNPRTEFDNVTKMACFHKRYILGDKDHCGFDDRDFSNWDEMERGIFARENVAVIRPLYMYDHSGITIKTTPFSCPWDSGQIGFVWITKETALKDFGIRRLTKKNIDRLAMALYADVETYDNYLTGEVYGYKVLDPDGEEVDSCWGFFGGDSPYMMEEAKGAVDAEIAHRIKMAKPENNKDQLTLGLEGVV